VKVSSRLITFGSPDYEKGVELRYQVLRKPLGIEYSAADLAREVNDLHVGAFSEGTLVGCLFLTALSADIVKMRQVAVSPAHQGHGVGRSLVEFSESLSRQRGARAMVLHARDTAVPFYLALGYEREGGLFTEVGIPHLKMHKAL
jgi:predicted GNAT family N-acyltransferase